MPCLAKRVAILPGIGSVKVRLKAISSCQSMWMSPATPCVCIRRVQSTASAPLTSIFLGSQPRSAQVPPNGRRSITATERPALRTRSAATCAAVPVPITIRSNASILVPCAKPLAEEAEIGQAEEKDQGRDQHIIRLGQPGGQPHRTKHDREDRRKATNRRNRRASNARRDKAAVVHRRSSIRVGDTGR